MILSEKRKLMSVALYTKMVFSILALGKINKILIRYRKKRSTMRFLWHYTVVRKTRLKIIDTFPHFLLSNFGTNKKELHFLVCVYTGLEQELGMARAVQATTELVGELNQLKTSLHFKEKRLS